MKGSDPIMRRPTSKILSLLMALAMILTMLPAAALATGEAESPFEGWSLTLGDDIGVNFYFSIASEDVENTVANITVADSPITISAADAAVQDGSYIFTVNVAAAQMTDVISLELVTNETQVHSGEYTVAGYAAQILEGEYDAEVKEMVLAMLNYGAAAQTYFAYNTDPLANAGYESAVTPAAVPETADGMEISGSVSGIALYGMSLVFKTSTAVRFYFTTEDHTAYTFTAGEETYTPVEKDGMCYVEIDGINPHEIADIITLNVADSEGNAISVSYSPLHYIVRKYNAETSSDELKAAVQALYGYYLEAQEYKAYEQIVQAGTLNAHESNHELWVQESQTFIWASMTANAAPQGEYSPLTADAIKLVRDGVTYSVGNPGQGTIVKDSDTQHLVKMASWTFTGNVLPLQENDYLIIEGRFAHTGDGTVMQIQKSYIYYNGSTVEFSTTEPVLPSTVEGGVMQTHVNGMSNNGIYFSMDANDATYNSDWSVEYAQTSVDNIKLIRNGETVSIGIVGRPLFVKTSETQYYLKLEGWTIGEYGLNSTNPITTDDVLIVEGSFYHESSKVTLNITKSYVYYDGSAWVCSDTEPVLPVTIDAGMMSAHSTTGWKSSADAYGNLLFDMEDNDAPTGYYRPTAEGNVKLIRDGVTYTVGHSLRDTISKENNDQYVFEFWTIADHRPMLANDILIVEGGFYQESTKTTLNITKTYILLNEDGTATFSATEPVINTVVEGGSMTEGEDNTVGTEVYFALAENAVPVDENAETAYTAADGVIQLVSNGTTTELSGSVIKYDAEYYILTLDVELADNDYLIVEGAFSNADNGYTLNISKTYILADGGVFVFSETEPVLTAVYEAGNLKSHANGWNTNSNDGLYFTVSTENDAPSGSWDYEYTPASAENYQLIRDGETVNIGIPGRGTLVKVSNSEYYLKFGWCVGDYSGTITVGDTLVVQGQWYLNSDSSQILNFTKTYIYVGESYALSFYTIDAGVMTSHSNGWNTNNNNGLYATMAENDAPYSGWDIEYTPASADVVKLVRDGVTYNIGRSGAGQLVKTEPTTYYLKLESWIIGSDLYPIVSGDQIIVEGVFSDKNDGSSPMYISKTVITVGDSYALSFDSEESDDSSTIDAGMMLNHADGWTANGLKFMLAANDAPYDSWNVRYTPTAEENVKLIRDGVTYTVGHTARETICKYSDTEYFFEFWVLGDYKPVVAGDILVVEGEFVNASNGYTLNITKTYVLFNEDGSADFYAINAGVMTSHSNGWNTNNNNGLYATMAENDAPYSGWDIEYTPASADVVKLVRDGVTYNIGRSGAGQLVKTEPTTYYLKLESWIIGSDLYPIVPGDQIIVEGVFSDKNDGSSPMYISKTYIDVGENYALSFYTDEAFTIDAGSMYEYSQVWHGNGVHFSMDSNALPANEDWTVEYAPTSTAAIKLIRDGETTEVARVGAGTIIKITDEDYYLKIEDWTITSGLPLVDGDILVVEGAFVNASNGYTMNVEKTYVIFDSIENGTVTFTTNYADTEFGEVLLPSSSGTVTIGVWNGSYHLFTDDKMAELQAAGITQIIGIDPQWIGSENSSNGIIDMNILLDRAEKYGISIIAYARLRNADGTAYSGDDWDGVTLPDYATHPALLGFILDDEPSVSEFTDLVDLKAKYEAVMPADKLLFVNLYPECASNTSWYGNLIGLAKDYETDYVDAFITKYDPDVLSWDNYSLLSGSGIRTSYFHNFEIMVKKGVPAWYTLLSSGHNTTSTSYATPTYEELRWQMAVAMTYGINNLTHYTYTSGASDYSCMVEYETWEATDLYYDIKQADNEIKAWEDIFMAYDYLGTAGVAAGSSSTMLDMLENEIDLTANGLTAVSASEDLLVGVFDHNGSKAYMVTNAGSAGSTTVGDGKNFTITDTTVTLTLDDGDYKCVAVIDEGEITYMAVENNTVTLSVEAYEGVFVIPVLN